MGAMSHPGTAFHLVRWIEEHAASFRPPVANREVFPESEFIFQIVRGPNARNDFHIDPFDEIFFQIKGHIFLHFIDADGKEQKARIGEGEVFLLRKNVYHSPRRPPGTGRDPP